MPDRTRTEVDLKVLAAHRAAVPSVWLARAACALPFRLERTEEPEWIDASGHEPAVLIHNLEDLSRINHWLGGSRLTIRALERLASDVHPGTQLSVIDVATGGADIPRAILAWGQRHRLRMAVVATDISDEILTLARRYGADGPTLCVADARGLPFGDQSVDVATCSLALHHLSPDDAVAMLREMHRIARLGVIVNDLVRAWPGYLGAWALTRALSSNRLTRHDGPLSVRRAYTPAEMARLAARAGLGRVFFSACLGYRVTMVTRQSE